MAFAGRLAVMMLLKMALKLTWIVADNVIPVPMGVTVVDSADCMVVLRMAVPLSQPVKMGSVMGMSLTRIVEGLCPACDDGLSCVQNADCIAGNCLDARCQPAACGDGIRNGNETAIDCGWTDVCTVS